MWGQNRHLNFGVKITQKRENERDLALHMQTDKIQQNVMNPKMSTPCWKFCFIYDLWPALQLSPWLQNVFIGQH